jgi:hypothetical protein
LPYLTGEQKYSMKFFDRQPLIHTLNSMLTHLAES